jgi:hypothetical protein
MIIRADKNVAWIIMPSEKMYMEQPIDKTTAPKTSKEMEGETERVSLGKEAVNGAQTEKFRVTYQNAKGQESIYQWLTNSGFPVKMEAVDGSWGMEYKNISW